MQVLVDTDILSFYLFKNYPILNQNIEAHLAQSNQLCIGRPTIFEIRSGLLYKGATKQLAHFEVFIANHQIFEITARSAEISAEAYAHLRKIGKHSGFNDLYLAGIAIENNLFLCTNNEKDYQNIAGLHIINWAK